jgi:hypothetical protein
MAKIGMKILVFLSVCILTSFKAKAVEGPTGTAENPTKKQSEHPAASLKISQAAKTLENMTIQDLVKRLNQQVLEKDLQMLETAEIKKVIKRAAQNERVKKYKAFLSEQMNRGTKVAIIGQSALELSSTGFNADILADLLDLIKEDHPKAVFLAGNILYGLIPYEEPAIQEKRLYIDLPPSKNIFSETFQEEKGYYSSEYFKKKLVDFMDFVHRHLGTDISLYPVMGAQEAIGPDAAKIFREVFHLENAVILDSNQLVYTVAIGKALFIMLSTDYFDKTTGQPKQDTLSEEAWKWLETTLKSQSANYDFIFVVGSDPVFSTTASFGIRVGLDVNTVELNKFWGLLTKFKVRAYFCGGEVLYDRSYRKGGWQIITGGGGTPHEYLSEIEDTFYHFVLMNIPLSSLQNPQVQVFDKYGEKKDPFFLTKTPPFLYQYRISREE